MAEGARLESVFRGNSNVGSNPTLSAMFSTTWLSCDPQRDPLSAWQSQTHDLAVCLWLLDRHHVAIDIHRRADVRVPHELLLHGYRRSHGVGALVPTANRNLFGRVVDFHPPHLHA